MNKILDLTEIPKNKRKYLLENDKKSLIIGRWEFIHRCRMNNPATGKAFNDFEEYINSDLDLEERQLLHIYTNNAIDEPSPQAIKDLNIIYDFFFVPTQRKFNFSHEYYLKRLQKESRNV